MPICQSLTRRFAIFLDPFAASFDPLAAAATFWCDEITMKLYPHLAPLAQDLLSAPASQAYVERVFSVCGDMCARKRNRTCKNLESRVFLMLNKSYLNL